jgi:radical SAM protein with 4Fe4S-binding SPASM domain
MTIPSDKAFDFFVQLHLTERCNLRCKHCYQTGRNVDEMSLAEVREVVGEISDTLNEWKDAYGMNFSPSFNVTGGEPFLRSDLTDILSEIGDRGFDIYLLTNGILIDKREAKALLKIGVKGVQISIEGPEEIHEEIRGKGSYSSSLKGVRNLLDEGLNVSLNVTLSHVNAGSFMDIIDMALNIGVNKVGFSRLVPSGRGEGMSEEMLGAGTLKALYKKIFSLETGDLQIVTGDPVASQSVSEDTGDMGDIPSGGCAAGLSGITILPDGTIVPCRRLCIPIGNIRKDSFREIWSTSSVLGTLRDRNRYGGKCGTCRRWANCRGCRAIAYAFSKAKGKGDFLAEDPQCFVDQ